MAGSVYKYDDATWHSDGDFPTELPAEAGATHIGMFVVWAILRGHASDALMMHKKRLEHRLQSPGRFCVEDCAGALLSIDLSEKGNKFALTYYNIDNCMYFKDLEMDFTGRVKTLYHIPDAWSSFETIAKRIDVRYESSPRWR